MIQKIFIFSAILLFLGISYQYFNFQKWMFQSIKEGFTPQDVEGIIQPPGSYTIGSVDPDHLKDNKMLTVSNGYTKDVIDNLRPSDPEPFDKETTNSLGDFPEAEQEKNAMSTTEFEYPNNHKFTVEYKCRKTATGMFSDCGTYSANTAWTADPYKGLNCPLANTDGEQKQKNVTN
jgi:hypothetical protein